MGSRIESFCKCQNNEISSLKKFERNNDKESSTRSNSRTKKNQNLKIINKEIIKYNCIKSLNNENNIIINKIKLNTASRKITKFFLEVKKEKKSIKELIKSENYFNTKIKEEKEEKKEKIKIENKKKIKIISDFLKENSPSTYLGATKKGIKQGLGFQIFYTNNKDNNNKNKNLIKSVILISNFINNYPIGIGKAYFIKKYHCYYYGEFKEYFAEGYGIYYDNEKSYYEGYWKNDSPFQIGIEKWDDDSFYQGEYFKGKKKWYWLLFLE